MDAFDRIQHQLRLGSDVFRVCTPLAAQGTAFQEQDAADPRTVVYAELLDIGNHCLCLHRFTSFPYRSGPRQRPRDHKKPKNQYRSLDFDAAKPCRYTPLHISGDVTVRKKIIHCNFLLLYQLHMNLSIIFHFLFRVNKK